MTEKLKVIRTSRIGQACGARSASVAEAFWHGIAGARWFLMSKTIQPQARAFPKRCNELGTPLIDVSFPKTRSDAVVMKDARGADFRS